MVSCHNKWLKTPICATFYIILRTYPRAKGISIIQFKLKILHSGFFWSARGYICQKMWLKWPKMYSFNQIMRTLECILRFILVHLLPESFSERWDCIESRFPIASLHSSAVQSKAAILTVKTKSLIVPNTSLRWNDQWRCAAVTVYDWQC